MTAAIFCSASSRRGPQRVVDRGHDEVLEHLDVVGVDRRRVDRDADELLLAGDRRADDAAAGRAVDDGRLELGLDRAASPAASAAPSAAGWPSPSGVSSRRWRVGQSAATGLPAAARRSVAPQLTSPTSARSSAKMRRASATRSSGPAVGELDVGDDAADRDRMTDDLRDAGLDGRSATFRRVLEERLLLGEAEGHDRRRRRRPAGRSTMSGLVGGCALSWATIVGQAARSSLEGRVRAGRSRRRSPAVPTAPRP